MLPLVIAAVVAGVFGWIFGHSAGRASIIRNGRPKSALDDLLEYSSSLDEVGRELVPAWSGHVSAARAQMQVAIEDLAVRFGEIVTLLHDAVEASHISTGVGLDADVFSSSRDRLGQVIAGLDDAIGEKERSMTALATLADLNERMKTMTGEVTRIAAQTHMLALNAAIEAERVGEAGEAFRVVAMEVRQLADSSGHTGKRIQEIADQFGEAITEAVEMAARTAAVEGEVVQQAHTQVDDVLVDLESLVDRMQSSASDLGRTTAAIKDRIALSIVDFQFQDRISQTLTHVEQNLEAFATELENCRDTADGRLRPIDHVGLLDLLKKSYTMAEEHVVHAEPSVRDEDSDAPAAASNITFF